MSNSKKRNAHVFLLVNSVWKRVNNASAFSIFPDLRRQCNPHAVETRNQVCGRKDNARGRVGFASKGEKLRGGKVPRLMNFVKLLRRFPRISFNGIAGWTEGVEWRNGRNEGWNTPRRISNTPVLNAFTTSDERDKQTWHSVRSSGKWRMFPIGRGRRVKNEVSQL